MNLSIPHIESYGLSDIGPVRANNEDVWAELPEEHFYVLADGMGGHLAGEVAAKEAVLHVCDSMERFLRANPHPTSDAAKSHLRKALSDANTWIRSLSTHHPDLSGMGTTLCCLLVLGKTVICAHIGDSRIYRFRGKLERLTQDHSLREELLAQGELTEASAANFPYRNVLTRALGISAHIEPEIQEASFETGDVYFLSSDGLHDALSDKQMETILRQTSSLKEAAITLVDAAKEAGGTDNVTILMLRDNP